MTCQNDRALSCLCHLFRRELYFFWFSIWLLCTPTVVEGDNREVGKAVSWHLNRHLEVNTSSCIRGRISTLLTLSFLTSLVVNDHCWTEQLHARSHSCMWHITERHQECAWCGQRSAQGPTLPRVLWQAGCLEWMVFVAVLEVHRGLSFTVIHEMCCCHEVKPFASVLKGHCLKALYSWGISEFYPRKWKNSAKKEYCELGLFRRECCKSHS